MTTVIDDDLDLTQYGSGAVSWPLSSSPSRETDWSPPPSPSAMPGDERSVVDVRASAVTKGIAAIAVGIFVTGCGLGSPTGWVVQNGHVQFEGALPAKAPQGAIEVTSGSGTTVRFGGSSETMAQSNLKSLKVAQQVEWWVPIVDVPTLIGTQDRAFGSATIQLPAGISWSSSGQASSGPGPELKLRFNAPIPAGGKQGAAVTLYAPLRVLILLGTTAQGTKETLTAVVGVGHQFRWSAPKATPAVTLAAIASMREGSWTEFSPGNGGTTNRGQQSHHVSFANGGVQVRTEVTYQLSVSIVGHQDAVIYDQGTKWDHLFMELGEPQP